MGIQLKIYTHSASFGSFEWWKITVKVHAWCKYNNSYKWSVHAEEWSNCWTTLTHVWCAHVKLRLKEAMREKLNGGRRLHAFLSRLTIHRLTLLMKRRAMRKTAKQVFPTPTQSGRIKLLHACWFSRNGERKKKSIRVNHNWYTSFGGLRNKTPLKRDKFEHSCISSHSRSSRRLADITHSLAAINQSPLCSEKLGEARARAGDKRQRNY